MTPPLHKRPTKPPTSLIFSLSKKPPLSISKLSLILMASLLFLSLLSLLLFFTLSSSSPIHHNHHRNHAPTPKAPRLAAATLEIQHACQGTRYPDTCQTSLTQKGGDPKTAIDILQTAMGVSSDNLKTAQGMVKDILDASAGSINRTTASKNCIEVLENSMYRTTSTVQALTRGRFKDARAWMSAALLFQYDCWSALKYANDTSQVDKTMAFLSSLQMLTSNALSLIMAYDVYGNDTASWKPPKTERDGFWEHGTGSVSGFNGGFPSGLKPDVTVCKDGSGGCYKTVQEAVNAAPSKGGKKFVIHIKEGVYEETVRVPLDKRNVVFLGDGMGKTVITGSLKVGPPGISTYNTATVGVLGDGFMASGLTFQNTAGPDAHQAVAFMSGSDLSVIENCEFLGNQDTLYAHSLRQYYKSCRIEGNVDFIFGGSASVFQDSQIMVRPRQLKPEKGETNAVTAHGRTDPAQSTGFVFQNCLINGTEAYMALYRSQPKAHKNYLGRPWKEFSRTVFISSTLEALVKPEGWMPWTGDFALKTLYYGEFKNTGPGSDTSNRVEWSSQIPPEHVQAYSLENFIQGNEWIPTSSRR